MSPAILRSAALAATILCGSVFAAPPDDGSPKSIVGVLVSAGEDHVVVATRQTADGEVKEVRVPLREETTVRVNDRPAKVADLRAGDAMKIVVRDDAPGVAKAITVARVTATKDAEEQALENRARQARERRLVDRERERDERRVPVGRVFVLRLPEDSAAARAGFRPGDIAIFAREDDAELDATILRGLRVERLDARGGLVIEAEPAVPNGRTDEDTGSVPRR